jgi:two-component system alkaline phosphatase synthesis response regulator PhoP
MTITDISRISPHCILAVDDDPKILNVTEIILKKEGYSVALALSVAEAHKTLQERRIDLVLLDVMLSDGDGFSFCKAIKENVETRDVPVILLTA